MQEQNPQKNNPMVGVVMSTHNRADNFLKRAIQSVLDQTFRDFLLVIVDDASTDNTKDVVFEFQKTDDRIFFIQNTENFGCDTRPKNQGIKEIYDRGIEYIAFLDDDNEWRQDHLMALVAEVKKDPYLTLVYGDRWVIPSEEMKKEGMKEQIGLFHDYDPMLLKIKNYIDTSDVLVKTKALYEIGGFDENIKKFVDWNLWWRLTKNAKRMQRVPLIITNYYLHDNMKSVTNKEGAYNPETGLFTPTFDSTNCLINSGSFKNEKVPKVAVFTLTMNRLEYTKMMFATIRNTTSAPFDHYVVDNGSTDGTVDFLKELKSQGIIKDFIANDENHGIPVSSNQALDMINPDNYDYIIKVDNDAKFKTKNWLEDFIGIYSRGQMMCLSPYIEGLVGMPGGSIRQTYGMVEDQFLGMVNHLGGIFVMAPAKIYDKWRWPISGFMQGGNDVIFSNYVQNLGYQMAYVENHRIEHFEGTLGQEKKFPEYFSEKGKLRRTRYGSEN